MERCLWDYYGMTHGEWVAQPPHVKREKFLKFIDSRPEGTRGERTAQAEKILETYLEWFKQKEILFRKYPKTRKLINV